MTRPMRQSAGRLPPVVDEKISLPSASKGVIDQPTDVFWTFMPEILRNRILFFLFLYYNLSMITEKFRNNNHIQLYGAVFLF